MITNIQYNLFEKRDNSWAVRIESREGSFITNKYRTPEQAMEAAIQYCKIHRYFEKQDND